MDDVTFNALGGFDRPGPFFDRERLLPEQLAWLRAEMPALRARLAPLVIHGSDSYLNRLVGLSSNLQSSVSDCSPGQAFLFVTEAGRLAPCSFTPQRYGVPLDQVAALAELPHLFRERQRAQRDQACDNCRSTQVFGKFLIADF